MNESTYLGTEKTGKLLFKFAMPCIFGLIIQSLYNIVDQIFVGQGIGMIGNAATGIVFPLTMIGLGLGVFFGDGVAATVSVALGRGEGRNVHKAVGTSITVSLIIGIIYTIIYYASGDKLLYLVGATENNIEMTRQYGDVIFMMMPIFIVQTTMSSIIRTDGSPNYAMVGMLAGAIFNIIGDPVAIFTLKLGIAGAAYATIIGQFLSFIIYAAYFGRVKNFKIEKDSFIPKFSVLKRIMALGSSSLLTQVAVVVVSVVNNILLVTYGAASEYGSDVSLAAFVVIMKLFQIVLCIAIGIAAGGQPIVGYNYGAKKYDRVKEILKKMLLWTFVSCGICWALFQIFPTFFVELFGSDNASYIIVATKCLRIYLMFMVFACLAKVCAIFLQSIGAAKLAAPLSVFRDIVLIISSVILARSLGIDGIFYAAPFTDILTTVLTVILMVKVVSLMSEKVVDEFNYKAEIITDSERENILDKLIKKSSAGIIIAISREHGTAGKRIGAEVAKRLNIPFYCTEIMEIASVESGMSDVFIRDINTNDNTSFGGYYMSSSAVQYAMTAQAKAINRIADAGSCVMVGRACDYVLKERKDVIKIFIHAPFEYKVNKVMEMYNDSKDKAEIYVKKSDNARAMYYKSVSGHEWGESEQYDLSINASLGVEKVANVICSYIDNLKRA
ncbi:MAG: MATE family efflux transporter [Lachnospiraceae bacterium]|nr:MATE family efflux transporter [Lachnospiraceae bacterium]